MDIAGELTISPRHLQTLCQEVGGELVAERRQSTKTYQKQPLMTPAKTASPPIPLATIMIDGGRMQTRQPDHGPGVHDPAWRENKTAVLIRMSHAPSAEDPRPDLPKCFAQPLDTPRPEPAPSDPPPAEEPPAKPQCLVRTGLATLNDSETFGWMTAAAAEDRGFFTADTRAFVSDGLPYNWSIQRKHFGNFEPILDLVHAAEHVHDAAKAIGEGSA